MNQHQITSARLGQAAWAYIAAHNIVCDLIRSDFVSDHIEGAQRVMNHMRDEFLRQVGNEAQCFTLSSLGDEHTLPFAYAIYRAATGNDILLECL